MIMREPKNARKNRLDRVSSLRIANVIRRRTATFIQGCRKGGAEYPEITTDEWYADIMTPSSSTKAPPRF
jgi:isocitrate/isopropylmalate dehydrogenase